KFPSDPFCTPLHDTLRGLLGITIARKFATKHQDLPAYMQSVPSKRAENQDSLMQSSIQSCTNVEPSRSHHGQDVGSVEVVVCELRLGSDLPDQSEGWLGEIRRLMTGGSDRSYQIAGDAELST